MKSNGFTLIELLVAIGLFAIFTVIVTGIFTNFMRVERHSIAQGQLISDITSVLESFIKEARTGYGSTYASSGNEVTFINQNGNCVSYRTKEKREEAKQRYEIQRAEQEGGNNCSPGELAEQRFAPITGNTISVTHLQFDATPSEQEGGVIKTQGIITVRLTVQSARSAIPPVSIQNSVTSRQTVPYAQ